MKYIIHGGYRLVGQVPISGNKNSLFPCMAAAILTDQEVVIENVADIKDVEVLIQILKELGIKVSRSGDVMVVKADGIRKYSLPKNLVVKLRGSVVLAGAILGRLGRVSFYHPGGDVIGRRSIETHLEGFRALGVVAKVSDLQFFLQYNERDEISTQACDIFLPEASVTATENMILASVLGNRVVTLRNCAMEPHISDLCQMLIQMGADILGFGTNTLVVSGVSRLNGTRFRLSADPIEVGTYAVAAAITKGKITLTNLDNYNLDPILLPIKRFGAVIEEEEGQITVSSQILKSISKLTTNIWPGFPTDMMSLGIVLATQSKGVTLCHDWMYESRMFFVDKLISMGANITIADPHRVFVYGPTRLKGRDLETPDIRAGMALVLAALTAKGISSISKSELIERGYEDVVGKLRRLGAKIEKRED